jgi:hypothetical protein
MDDGGVRPSGVRVRLDGGGWAEIGDESLVRLPDDQDGMAVWLAEVPGHLSVAWPLEARVGVLPPRSTIRLEAGRVQPS